MWVALALVALTAVSMLTGMSAFGPEPGFRIAMTVAAVVGMLFWGFLIWLPLRYLRSSSVRELCSD